MFRRNLDWGALLSGRLIASLGIDAFGKLEVSSHYSQLLAEHFGLNLVARAQNSFGKGSR